MRCASGARRKASCTRTFACRLRSSTSGHTRVSPEITTVPSGVVTLYATASGTGSWCTATDSTTTARSAEAHTSAGVNAAGNSRASSTTSREPVCSRRMWMSSSYGSSIRFTKRAAPPDGATTGSGVAASSNWVSSHLDKTSSANQNVIAVDVSDEHCIEISKSNTRFNQPITRSATCIKLHHDILISHEHAGSGATGCNGWATSAGESNCCRHV